MNREELLENLKNEKFVKKLGASFVRSKDLDGAAQKFGLNVEDLEDIFIDHPEIEDKFNQAVYEYSRTLAYRKIRAGLDEAITRLNQFITDYDEDANTSYKSASTLLSVWARIDTTKTPVGGKEEKDDLDDLWDMIKDEERTEKDSENNKRIK